MPPEIRGIIITVSDQLLVVVGAYEWSTPELQLELIPGLFVLEDSYVTS